MHRKARVLVLSTRLLLLMYSIDSTCYHAYATPKSNMMFDSQLGRPTSDRNNMGSLNLDCFIINACINNFVVDKHAFHFWSRTRHRPNAQLLR